MNSEVIQKIADMFQVSFEKRPSSIRLSEPSILYILFLILLVPC